MRRAEHEQQATAFRAVLRAEAAKVDRGADRATQEAQRAGQVWPDEGEWYSVPAVVTCRTAGCPAQDRPFEVSLKENADGMYRATCGPCGTPHTEIVVTYEDAGPVNLAPDRRPAPPPGRGQPVPGAPNGREQSPPDEAGGGGRAGR